MISHANWIQTSRNTGDICPVFRKVWTSKNKIAKAELSLTALGTYEAKLNGARISDYVLAPGWTSYDKRLQYQTYDITEMLQEENDLRITVGRGWFSSQIPGSILSEDRIRRTAQPRGIIAKICLSFTDGSKETILTDESWEWEESEIKFSEIYDGENVDMRTHCDHWKPVKLLDWSKSILIPQEGELIKELERVYAKSIITTPAGETLVDFGQEVTGYAEFTVDAKEGDKIRILHGEVLDKHGNFYNANYRNAKAEINYICKEGIQTWHPALTFFGFRYLKLEEFPGEVKPEQFTAIVVYSDIKQTGYLRCSDAKVNQLFSNIFWSQKGNFLDVPTDCPQRDERLGWTGDAQVFIKTACYNYDVQKFFRKWLHDMKADQKENGSVGTVIPNYHPEQLDCSAWGDAVTICPWQVYLTYADKELLAEMYECMKKWVGFIATISEDPYLWTGGIHLADWLGLDAPSGSYRGSSREYFIASAYYANSTKLVIKAGKVLGEDVSEFEELYENIVKTFRTTYPTYLTQTEHVLAIVFELAEDLQKTADALAAMIKNDGCQLRTGFLGTPHVLHVLSEYGHNDLAYTLFLRKEYPSWLFSVEKGATTIWEHWDGIMENGDFWSPDMNSFNHYAYGSVASWVYEKAAGIVILEDTPGFAQVKIKPMPDERLEWLEASIQTKHGLISSKWTHTPDGTRYDIETAVPAEICIGQKTLHVKPGRYTLWA